MEVERVCSLLHKPPEFTVVTWWLTHRELLGSFPFLSFSLCFECIPLSDSKANIWFQDHETEGMLSAKKGLVPKV